MTTPPSLDEEHEEIMGALGNFAKFRDETGSSIKNLLKVLEPHFQKENKIVMPVLGALSVLVSGEHVPNLQEIAESQGVLLQEYDNMYKEHAQIKVLIEQATRAAKRENHQEVTDLLEGLAHHARVEEEVLYPAAVLAGTVAKCITPSAPTQAIA